MKGLTNNKFTPDESQQRVIGVYGGYHLVLAPPGCGKTQILTERIRIAHEQHGVAYDDMLCLTFTNRAARGMTERISQYIGDEQVENVFVGNVHRFCSKFLFENGIVAAESSIIDEEDAVSILARYLDEDETQVIADGKRRRKYDEIVHFSHFMHQIEHGHQRELRLHPECLLPDDLKALKTICTIQKMPFNPDGMADIYHHSDVYSDIVRSDAYDYGMQQVIMRTLRKMTLARHYEQYKQENLLLDFEDLLILTYDALSNGQDELVIHRYPWIQVDEIQDLNPLQLAIIDLLTKTDDDSVPVTVMYLGDEQQAIFSFMGAKMSTLEQLRQRCTPNIHRLDINHRSPAYLLNVFNCYATDVLGISPQLLPKADGDDSPAVARPLHILRSNTLETEYYDAVHYAESLYRQYTDETVAIVVSSNNDADMLSAELRKKELPHFKISGTDLFSTPEVKLLFAHLNILGNEHNFIAWSRLVKGLHVTASNAYARNFVRSMLDCGMLPSDLLLYDGSTYLQEFCRAYDHDEIVVFDTETTGLDVMEDDIIQIAAVRMRGGKIMKDEHFNMYIATDRQIPLKLGDIDNPIIDELGRNHLYTHVEALQRFVDFVGDAVLVGHNVQFDLSILHHNLRRYLPQVHLDICRRKVFDTLKLVKLTVPGMRQYKLKHLLSELALEGDNSHLADDDVLATCHLLEYCREKVNELLPAQRSFLERKRVKECAQVLRASYGECYRKALARLGETCDPTADSPALVDEMTNFYQKLLDEQFVCEVEGLPYIIRYLDEEVIDRVHDRSLAEQLARHLVEINTLKEADLCNSHSVSDRIFVSTVHKAKGLEFDNVIVFDAIEGRYPNYFSQHDAARQAEDARRFYVAMTRARKRLCVSQCLSFIDYRHEVHQRELTRFMLPIQKYFD